MAWSPEQIARRLPFDFPDDDSMRISHEAIYQALYVQGRGALRRELTACLRTGRALRMPRARVQLCASSSAKRVVGMRAE
jgi:IS30 family transposase